MPWAINIVATAQHSKRSRNPVTWLINHHSLLYIHSPACGVYMYKPLYTRSNRVFAFSSAVKIPATLLAPACSQEYTVCICIGIQAQKHPRVFARAALTPLVLCGGCSCCCFDPVVSWCASRAILRYDTYRTRLAWVRLEDEVNKINRNRKYGRSVFFWTSSDESFWRVRLALVGVFLGPDCWEY